MEPNDKNVKVTIEKEKEVIKWLTTQINKIGRAHV